MARESGFRQAMDRSRSGAPAAGHAVRDFFSGDEIFQRLVATADEEFSGSSRLLFVSGIAAGLSIGLSFVARAGVAGELGPEASPLLANLVYPVGFLLIVIGRYQLFTENTITPITLVLTRVASVPLLLKVWGVVLAANILGVTVFAWVLANTGVFTPEAVEAAKGFGKHALDVAWMDLFWKAVFAGFIVASMVWLTHAARDTSSRILIIFSLMFLIPSIDLFHCIIGACEVLFMVFHGEATLWDSFANFFVPVVVGNTIGGVVLVGTLNFMQIREHRFADRDCRQLELTWREWLFGVYSGSPIGVRDEDIGEIDPNFLSAQGERDLVAPIRDDDHMLGNADAQHTLTVYGDFECPYSRAAHQVLGKVKDRLGDDMRLVFRHFPLTRLHSHAMDAALAAVAASRQGKFWEYHDRLFRHQDALGRSYLLEYARDLDLDMEQFERDLDSEEVRERVRRDTANGRESGVAETPALFVDGYRYQDDISRSSLMSLFRFEKGELGDDEREPVPGE